MLNSYIKKCRERTEPNAPTIPALMEQIFLSLHRSSLKDAKKQTIYIYIYPFSYVVPIAELKNSIVLKFQALGVWYLYIKINSWPYSYILFFFLNSITFVNYSEGKKMWTSSNFYRGLGTKINLIFIGIYYFPITYLLFFYDWIYLEVNFMLN